MPMTEAVIRPAGPADLPACAAIVNAYIDATGWLPRAQSHADIAAAFSPELLSLRRVLVAARDDMIMGYAVLDPAARFLSALYLAPAARRMGIGKRLLDTVKTMAPTGFMLTVWKANRDALRFYRREGMGIVDEDTDEAGLAVLRLKWDGAA